MPGKNRSPAKNPNNKDDSSVVNIRNKPKNLSLHQLK